MYNHEPEGYKCPFCYVVRGIEGEFPYTKQADIFYKNDLITAIIASHWWPNNKGHVIIVPNEHIENLYNLNDLLGAAIQSFSRRVAIALKETYKCDGTSVRQHNEPEGDQDVWHYHYHVFPRYKGDNLYGSNAQKYLSKAEDRIEYVRKLREYFIRFPK